LFKYGFRIPMILVVVALISAVAGAAEDPSKWFTKNDYFNFEFVSDPQISPDGNRIIYVRSFADIKTDQFYSNLWIINFDGTGRRTLAVPRAGRPSATQSVRRYA